jgi:hypothetical protein
VRMEELRVDEEKVAEILTQVLIQLKHYLAKGINPNTLKL